MSDYIRAAAIRLPIDWDEDGKVHNWRNYIGERTRLIWAALPEDVRIALALDADDRAGLEDWE